MAVWIGLIYSASTGSLTFQSFFIHLTANSAPFERLIIHLISWNIRLPLYMSSLLSFNKWGWSETSLITIIQVVFCEHRKKKQSQVVGLWCCFAMMALKQECQTAGARHEATGTLLLCTAPVRIRLVIGQHFSDLAAWIYASQQGEQLLSDETVIPSHLCTQTATVVSSTKLTSVSDMYIKEWFLLLSNSTMTVEYSLTGSYLKVLYGVMQHTCNLALSTHASDK